MFVFMDSGPPIQQLSGVISSGSAIAESLANGAVTLSGTTTCTGVGGVPPYTHSYTRVSGATQITPTASTSATTGWASDGTDVVRSAVYKDTITDAAGMTYDITGIVIDATHGTPP